jgi:F-type H+-transporting ATPase subunit delta
MANTFAQKIVDPYAEALLSIGQDLNLIDTFATDVRLVLGSLQSTPELGDFLSSPVVKADAKKALLETTFGEQVHPILLTTLRVLGDRRRMMYIQDVCLRFLELQRKLQRIALAEVTSAVELSDQQKQTIADRVKQLGQADHVEVEARLDPDLIGGVVIKVGSQVIDLSIRGQLRKLALQLA